MCKIHKYSTHVYIKRYIYNTCISISLYLYISLHFYISRSLDLYLSLSLCFLFFNSLYIFCLDNVSIYLSFYLAIYFLSTYTSTKSISPYLYVWAKAAHCAYYSVLSEFTVILTVALLCYFGVPWL